MMIGFGFICIGINISYEFFGVSTAEVGHRSLEIVEHCSIPGLREFEGPFNLIPY